AQEETCCSLYSEALPKGLRGSYFRNGPAKFKVGDDQIMHPFDGDGMAAKPRSESCLNPQNDTARSFFTAAVQVLVDEDAVGSVVTLSIASAFDAPLVQGPWQLCFTWMKAVVLRRPMASSGSYVCLPSVAEILSPGNVKAFVVELAAPSMRHLSDLPRALHIVCTEDSKEQIYDVQLALPGESQVRLAPLELPTFPGVPQAAAVSPLPTMPGFALSAGLQAPVELKAVAEAQAAAELLKEWLQVWPPGAPLWPSPGDASARRTWSLGLSKELLGEAYELRIEDEFLELLAGTKEGFLRGVASIRQLFGIALAEGWPRVPAQILRDRPRFGHRGLMLDVARHFFPVSFVKRLLDWMFLYKLNVFHWHLTDDEGWRLEIRSLPNLTTHGAFRGRGHVIEPQYGGDPRRYGGFYSHDDVREVLRYAEQRGITVVPEIDVPGHCYAALQALPELAKTVEKRKAPRSVQGFRGNVLDVRAEVTFAFLEAVLIEVLELFPGPVHVGMDEIPARAWSQQPEEEERLKAMLAAWLQEFLGARGRAMLAWEEAFSGNSGVVPNADPRPAAMAWKDDERFAVQAANVGLDIILCPAHFLYLDIVQDLNFEDKGLYWAAPALPLHRVYDYEPLERLKRLGLRADAVQRLRGVQANLWTETVESEERAQEMLFPRLLAVAELAWTMPERKVWEDFKFKLGPQLQWLTREASLQRWNWHKFFLAKADFMRVKSPSL
ncbi:unnamed protein product, partial [Cladocopium goreaui]